ncbi:MULTISPECIES: hypothetical protein [unclassified Microcoleus]|uniref:hypothetical protein n=1 Tax=unclassified Microcoleus TaxID=2642155 RepID=UPI002FD1D976
MPIEILLGYVLVESDREPRLQANIDRRRKFDSITLSTWSENKPAIAEAQSKLLEPLPPSNASEKVSPTPESSESKVGNRLNKQTLNNAILL